MSGLTKIERLRVGVYAAPRLRLVQRASAVGTSAGRAMTHCRSAECRATARDHALVPDGPGDKTRRVPCDACGCLCAACDAVTVASGFRAPWVRQMEMFE